MPFPAISPINKYKYFKTIINLVGICNVFVNNLNSCNVMFLKPEMFYSFNFYQQMTISLILWNVKNCRCI